MSEWNEIRNPDIDREPQEVPLGSVLNLEKMYPRFSGDVDTTSYRRLNCARLEFSATHDPILFAALAFWRDAVIETFDPNLINFKNPKDRASVERILEIARSRIFRDFFLDKAPIHLGLYGRCLGEIVLNPPNRTYYNAIVCLRPHEIDFFRKDSSSVVYFDDVTGVEKGFVQESVEKGDEICVNAYFDNIDALFDTKGKLVETESEIDKKAKSEGKRVGVIMCLQWNQINRGDWGYGFIEPVYDDTTIKANMENAKGENAARLGHITPLVFYGNDQYKPDAKMEAKADEIGKSLANPNTNSAALPYFYRVDSMANLLGKTASDSSKELIYQATLQAASAGIPIEILMQTGNNNPERLIPFLEIKLKSIQQKLRIDDFFNYILKLEGYTDQHVTVPWRELTMQSAKERVMQMFRLGKAKLVNFKDSEIATKWAWKVAGLPYVEQTDGIVSK